MAQCALGQAAALGTPSLHMGAGLLSPWDPSHLLCASCRSVGPHCPCVTSPGRGSCFWGLSHWVGVGSSKCLSVQSFCDKLRWLTSCLVWPLPNSRLPSSWFLPQRPLTRPHVLEHVKQES